MNCTRTQPMKESMRTTIRARVTRPFIQAACRFVLPALFAWATGMVSAEASQYQRSIIIEPYPQEKVAILEQRVNTIAGPAAELVDAIGQLERAKSEYDRNSTPQARAEFRQAIAVSFDRVTRFVEKARETRVPLAVGFEDLADYLDTSASRLMIYQGNHPGTSNTVHYMRRRAQEIRTFSKDFFNMVGQLDGVAADLAQHASGYAIFSQVEGVLQDTYGPGGAGDMYQTMGRVVDAMIVLKEAFMSQDLFGGGLDNEAERERIEMERENYEHAIQRYYEQ